MGDGLLSAAELGRALRLSPARISQLKAEGLPYVKTRRADRFDLRTAARWHADHIGRPHGGSGPGALNHDAGLDREFMRRMVPVVERAIREHVAAIQRSDRSVNRLRELMQAVGVTDERQLYLLGRVCMTWVGVTAPGEVAVMMPSHPADSPEAAWEREFVAIIAASIARETTL